MCLPTACCSRLRQNGAQLSRMDGRGLPRPGEERKHRFGPFRPSDLGFCPAVGTLLESQRASLEPVSGFAEALQGSFPQVPRPPGGPNGGGPGSTGRKFFLDPAPPEGSRAADCSRPGTGANPRGQVEAPESLDRRPERLGSSTSDGIIGRLRRSAPRWMSSSTISGLSEAASASTASGLSSSAPAVATGPKPLDSSAIFRGTAMTAWSSTNRTDARESAAAPPTRSVLPVFFAGVARYD
jgi:hypothetical protein